MSQRYGLFFITNVVNLRVVSGQLLNTNISEIDGSMFGIKNSMVTVYLKRYMFSNGTYGFAIEVNDYNTRLSNTKGRSRRITLQACDRIVRTYLRMSPFERQTYNIEPYCSTRRDCCYEKRHILEAFIEEPTVMTLIQFIMADFHYDIYELTLHLAIDYAKNYYCKWIEANSTFIQLCSAYIEYIRQYNIGIE